MLITIIVLILAALGITRICFKVKSAPKLIVGDETWDGTFFCKAPEFSGPAYVYKDGKEGAVVRFDVPIVGYRVAEGLVVAVDFGFDVLAHTALDLAQKKHMRLPKTADLQFLQKNRNAINELKGAVEDFFLPEAFWVIVDGKPEIYSFMTQTVQKCDKKAITDVRTAEAIFIVDR